MPTLPDLDALPPGVSLPEAVYRYGPLDVVAELERIDPNGRPMAVRFGAPGMGMTISAEALARVTMRGVSADYPSLEKRKDELRLRVRLWRHLIGELGAQRLYLTYQPADPTAPRQVLSPDRCAHLEPDSLFLSHAGNRLRLDGHVLPHVTIHPAPDIASNNDCPMLALAITRPTETKFDEWCRSLPQPPTMSQADLWASDNGYSRSWVRGLLRARYPRQPGRPRKIRQ
jgi:hypothetical protein